MQLVKYVTVQSKEKLGKSLRKFQPCVPIEEVERWRTFQRNKVSREDAETQWYPASAMIQSPRQSSALHGLRAVDLLGVEDLDLVPDEFCQSLGG